MNRSSDKARAIAIVLALALCLSLAGAVYANPPPGGNNGGNGGGGKGGKGGKTALVISFPDCPSSVCADPIRSDGAGDYIDGVEGVEAFLDTQGGEIVFNTGKIGDPRDVHWDFGAAGVDLATGETIKDTGTLDSTTHRTLLDIGRNAGVSIRDLTKSDGPTAIDMWGNLTVNLSGRKKDATVIFPRFESTRASTFGGERCLNADADPPGVLMTGTDVTIECVADDGNATPGSCTEWEIEGTDPATSGSAIACVYAVFPGSTYRGDYTLGPFRIRATVK